MRESRGGTRVRTSGSELAILVIVELVFFIYSLYKGTGFFFLQMALIMLPMSLISWLVVSKYHADKYLLVIVILFLNFGFLIQVMSGKTNKFYGAEMLKCLGAFAAAYIAAFLYRQFAGWLSMDIMVPVLMSIQLVLMALLAMFGTDAGEIGQQGAKILLKLGPVIVQPLEVVKVIYAFVIVTLLCKEERKEKHICGMPREMFLMLYTLVLAVCMAAFSEFGTVLIMLLLGGVMMFVYSSNRILVNCLTVFTLLAGSASCFLLLNLKPKSGRLHKLYLRLQYFLHPELDCDNAGYHGMLIRKALSVGGLLGPDTKRYMFPISHASTDMAFVRLVQCCGILMGILLIFACFFLLKRGCMIAEECSDTYFGGVAMSFTMLITLEAIVHIAYNISFFPITGLPLYIVSEGFTATTTGMMMIAVLLVVSADRAERSMYNERKVERRMGNCMWNIYPHRKRSRHKGGK